MRKLILLTLLFLVNLPNILPNLVMNKPVEPGWVNSPRSIAQWYKENFVYEDEKIEYFKKPFETIKDKAGDCEDYAILTCHILKKHGYECKIVIMYHIEYGHAIAVYKNRLGNWNSFDNTDHILNNKKYIREILDSNYDGWYKAWVLKKPSKYYWFRYSEKYVK